MNDLEIYKQKVHDLESYVYDLKASVHDLKASVYDLREELKELRGYVIPMIPLGPKYPSNIFSIKSSIITDEDKDKFVEKIKEMKKIKDCKNLK